MPQRNDYTQVRQWDIITHHVVISQLNRHFRNYIPLFYMDVMNCPCRNVNLGKWRGPLGVTASPIRGSYKPNATVCWESVILVLNRRIAS